MMKITVNYDRKDCFGKLVFAQDEIEFATIDNIKTAFKVFKNNSTSLATIWFDVPDTTMEGNDRCSYVVSYDGCVDKDNDIVSIQLQHNYYNIEKPIKMSMAKAKKFIIGLLED